MRRQDQTRQRDVAGVIGDWIGGLCLFAIFWFGPIVMWALFGG